MDTSLSKKISTGLVTLNRIADSLEKLVDEPLLQIEQPPIQCPHCGKVNPAVQIEESESQGKIDEYALEATCMNCGRPMFGVVFDMVVFKTRSEAVAVLNQRKAQNGNS